MSSIIVGGEDLGSGPYEAILRLRRDRDEARAELGTAREKLAAAEHFAGIWRDTLPEPPDAYMCTYTCAEANAAADLYRALGDEDTARAIIAAHAAYDEDEDVDQHWAGRLT